MATTTYLWDPFDDNVVSEHDGTTETAYTHEPGQYGDLISQRDGTSSKFYHFDARGDTREITDESENVTDTRTYDAWGNVIASTGSTPTPYQFVGKLGYAFDATLDQYYVRARWYQQQVGRWMSEDPLGIRAGLKIYSYGFASPIIGADPSGLWPLCQTEVCNTGPRQHAGEGHYVLRVEVVGVSGDRCGTAGQEVRFHMRESHIDPKTQKCIGYAEQELTAIDPRRMRFGDIVTRGCSAPQVRTFRVGPNRCWVADYKWTCPITCDEQTSSCQPANSGLSVYNPRLLELPKGERPQVSMLVHIMRANVAVSFSEQCPCVLSGCNIDSSIDWIGWTHIFAVNKEGIPEGAVDIERDRITGGWWYRLTTGSVECEGDFSWVWRL
jgi:RHS repeat-associated protein